MLLRIFPALTGILLILLAMPSLAQSPAVAIEGGRLLTVSHGVIESGTLVLENGLITALGPGAEVPADARRIDASGLVVMPGLIDGFTNLGSAEIASFGSDDDEATAPILPHLRISDALNPDNRYIPMARQAGITAVLCAPADGNLLSGQSALIRLAGDRMSAMVIEDLVAVHACLGEPPKQRYGANNRSPMTRMGIAAELRQVLLDARDHAGKLDAYQDKLAAWQRRHDPEEQEPAAPDRDLKLEALVPVVRGERPLVASVNRFDDLHTILRIAAELELELIISHGAESDRVAELLVAAKIPVIVGPSRSFPGRQESQRAAPDLAARLHRAGVTIAFQSGGCDNIGGLLEEARLAVANGLPAEEARKALTLYPARIFGAGDRLGSLEPGKSADIVVFDRDPLYHAAQVRMLFIQGRQTLP
jgi:imidazolonepropionase-like amidohydrolase